LLVGLVDLDDLFDPLIQVSGLQVADGFHLSHLQP